MRDKLKHANRQNEELHGELEAAQHLAKEREGVIEECRKLSAECSSQVSQIVTECLPARSTQMLSECTRSARDLHKDAGISEYTYPCILV